MPDRPRVVDAVLGWSNPDTGPESCRLYALDDGPAPRWAKPHARVVETALREHVTPYPSGIGEGDRYLVVRIGDRFLDADRAQALAGAVEALLDEWDRP